MKKTYGIKVTKVDPLGVDTPQTKKAVSQGADQLALVLTTDATVSSSGLQNHHVRVGAAQRGG